MALMNVDDVSAALRVSSHTVRRWASQGKLKKIKLGSRVLFDPAEVARFVERASGASSADIYDHPKSTR